MMTGLRVEPLCPDTFSPFGDVIQARGPSELINFDTVSKYSDLARIDLGRASGRPAVHLYHATAYEFPLVIRMLERHPLSSQLFMPLHRRPFLIVVSPPGETVHKDKVRAFITDGEQGINYHAGTWHHPVIAINETTDFLVLDRIGPDENCDEHYFDGDNAPLVTTLTD